MSIKQHIARVALRLSNCDRGATAIEYGLIIAAIALSIVAIVFTMGDQLVGMIEVITTKL